ncbi:MAG: TetR/AcrR family transcriptional regulator [Saprospiraceae bacterium]|nr:TetR/AcrR family transcriptional regulator [Saprospiraceae bacterium]
MAEVDMITQRAEELFLRFGIKSISMDDLSRDLGISKKTLYRHVETKDELVNTVITCKLDEHEEHLAEIKASKMDPILQLLRFAQFATEMLVRLSPTTVYDLRKYYRKIWERLDDRRNAMIYGHIHHNLQLGKKKGLYRKDVDSDLIASLYVRMSTFMFDTKAIDAPRSRKIRLYFEFVKYHIRGIATEKGHQLLNQYEHVWHE